MRLASSLDRPNRVSLEWGPRDKFRAKFPESLHAYSEYEGDVSESVEVLRLRIMAHRSPRKSITYACTPPGIFTSTRTSTLENALKQLRVRYIHTCNLYVYCRGVRTNSNHFGLSILYPYWTSPHHPRERKLRSWYRQQARRRIQRRLPRRNGMYRSMWACVVSNKSNRAVQLILENGWIALTSCCPLLAVLFTTWTKSGGPSSRNVASTTSE